MAHARQTCCLHGSELYGREVRWDASVGGLVCRDKFHPKCLAGGLPPLAFQHNSVARHRPRPAPTPPTTAATRADAYDDPSHGDHVTMALSILTTPVLAPALDDIVEIPDVSPTGDKTIEQRQFVEESG